MWSSMCKRSSVCAAFLISLGLAAGCSSKSESPPNGLTPPTTTSFIGIMMNGMENGALRITIASTALAPMGATSIVRSTVVDASATYRPIGAPEVSLIGTYDVDTDSLHLAGGGYMFSTMVETDGSPASFAATYTGPNGIGFAGAVENTAGASNLIFCGTYASSSTPENGNISFLVSDSVFAGIPFSALGGDPLPFEGTVTGTGTVRTISGQGGQTGVNELTVSGTVNTTTNQASGTWQLQDFVTPAMDSGTWSASLCP